ncbi:LysR family transcriptional regulator [Rhizobium rhizogenes]|uniref:LysR family transcriptional regulator n=1 Tax=Rhizobium rhizogenes TaxID=359 RepID=UPI001573F7F9|nr:LysR family transcriptional regulator [Rhizobium rhizogenes]NTF46133.1 LysR family transcriptional regulator [Rhizobium rhizogenes]
MHSRILTYVDEVARRGSIRAAAERLNVAASAISRQIKTLEDEMGTPIFNRSTYRLTLTAAGEILVRHARDTLKELERTKALIEDLKGLRRGEIGIAMMSGLAANIVPRAVVQFRNANPRVTVHLRLMTTGENILDAVASGDVDLGLGFDFVEHTNVRVLSIALAPLGAVVAPDHPLAERSSLRLSECVRYPLILADKTTAIRPYIDQVFERSKITPSSSVETNSIEMMRQIAINEGGISFLTPFDIESELALGRLVYIPVQELATNMQQLMLVSAKRSVTALASVFAEHLKPAMLR